MYQVMVGEKVNLHEVIFFYWLQAFNDRFHAKDKKSLVPYGMLFMGHPIPEHTYSERKHRITKVI